MKACFTLLIIIEHELLFVLHVSHMMMINTVYIGEIRKCQNKR